MQDLNSLFEKFAQCFMKGFYYGLKDGFLLGFAVGLALMFIYMEWKRHGKR